jgi:diguanylate cyclase (GGDEF)-like protein
LSDNKPISNFPGKSIRAFRLIIIFVVACGFAEIVETFIEPHISSYAMLFELLEHTTLVGLLLFFMTKYVTNPILREMELRTQSEQRLQQSEIKNLNIIDAMPDAVLRIASDGNVIEYQPKRNANLTFKIGSNVSDSLPPDVVLNFLYCMNSTLKTGENNEIDLMFRQGDAVCYHAFNFVKSSEDEVIVFARDITRRKVYEEQLKHLGSHDVLTGLYNRTYYESELSRLATSRRYPVSMIIIDLDGLKSTNDSYGHAVGDKMICKAANVLKSAFRDDDLVARTGGDEFTVILPETGSGALQTSVDRIESSLNTANRIEDSLDVKFSLGVATAETKEDLLEALKLADKRMYQNKAIRKNLPNNVDLIIKKQA